MIFAGIANRKGLFFLYFLIGILLAVCTFYSMLVRENFIDSIINGSKEKEIIMLLVMNLFIVFVIRYLLPTLSNLLGGLLEEKTRLSVEERINKKKNEIPFALYENSQIRDLLILAEEGPKEIWTFWKAIVNSCAAILSVAAIFIMLCEIGLLTAGLLLVIFIPVFVFSIKAGRGYYDTWKRTAELRRHCDDQRDVLLDKTYAQEKIHYHFGPFFLNRWISDFKKIRSLSIKEELKGAKQMQISGILFCLFLGILLYVMVQRLIDGTIGVGYVVSMISIVPMLFSEMIMTLSNEINSMTRAFSAAKALQSFLELEEEKGAWDSPKHDLCFEKIEMREVSFRYPGTEKWILKDLNLCFERGKHYSFVGENGAGKSTIIKLLLGLYRVTEGGIYIDGKNIKEMERSEISGLMCALFQDYKKYYIRADQNIGIGDVAHLDDMESIQRSAESAGIKERILNMQSGFQTMLGGMHQGGVDLSGGEWQRIGLARLIMSPCQLVILDEPTASMDPIFEHEIYEKFMEELKERTTISISHRLASCRSSDCIFVIDQGKMVEFGDHEALMKKGGTYMKMYQTQRDMYL